MRALLPIALLLSACGVDEAALEDGDTTDLAEAEAILAPPLDAIPSPDALEPGAIEPDPDDPNYLPPDLLPKERGSFDDLLGGLEGDIELEEIDPEDTIDLAAPDLPPDTPDYSALPPAEERAARLDALFERLAEEDDTERAKLVSEEIWAIWMDSGSPSVNYLLTRADDAQKRGLTQKTRRFLDRMTGLEPDFAEAYARSARLALDEEDFSRAIADSTEALIREPRHFYAMWTLGNTLERIGKKEEALAVYEEAHTLFPKLGGVKERLDILRGDVLGDVL